MAGRPDKEGDTGMAPVVTMRQLLESGVHFGHQTRRWNPKMKRFILTERNGIYIIDLQQSLDFIDRAYDFIKETVAHGGSVLYVGTKKQAQEAIAEQARRVGMPFVNQRWLGGMLTNFDTVYKRLAAAQGAGGDRLRRHGQAPTSPRRSCSSSAGAGQAGASLGGIRDMARMPSAIWVVDTKKEHIAVSEARKLGIPVIAILDTNCDPDEVQYPIPGNDDAIRCVGLLTRIIADAVAEGLIARAGAAAAERSPRLTATSARSSRWPSGSGSCSRARPNAGAAAAHANGAAPSAPAASAAPLQRRGRGQRRGHEAARGRRRRRSHRCRRDG